MYPEWENIPAFAAEMKRYEDAGVFVTREIALRVMRVIYDEAENDPASHAGFPFELCEQSIRTLEHEIAQGI